jgi:small-conductance mechanosensitive channel
MDYIFHNNELESWAMALGIAVGVTALMHFARAIVLHRLAAIAGRTATRADDLAVIMLAKSYLLLMVPIGLYVGSLALALSERETLILSRMAVAALLLQVAIWGDVGLRAWRDQFRITNADGSRRASSTVLCFISRLVLWAIISLMILDNFGFNVTTLVASLGIGGVAVALAVQSILADLFASLSIMLDKPFEIGDFIIVGDVLGSVEHIGLKTTRLRALGGEQVVFSNDDLLKSRIHNHKRMQTRRVVFVLRVAYGTSDAQLLAIPEKVRAVITARDDVNFERAHFFRYGDWSLDFEVVYHHRSPDYILHMDAQQDIFLELYRCFAREGIQFGHPLSIVHLAEQPAPARPRAPLSAASAGTFGP